MNGDNFTSSPIEYIYRDILSLTSPVGEFTVRDGEKSIPFNIRKNDYNVPYYDITPETNYALDIDTSLLSVGKKYDIVFSEGGLHFFASDQHTEAITNTIGNYSVGIGSFDMNDDDDFFPDKQHTGYDVWKSKDNLGFSFVLLDRTVKTITFLVAWIEHSAKIKINYEDAISFWLT